MSDGVEVILDVWDLNEGDDKYAFMERMVTDESVSHVLVFSDQKYAAKADAREAGVGTESQIISQEVYSKVKQSKFIPIVCEFDDAGEPALPTFLKSRIWIDFATPEAANDNWERLVRLLFGRPELEKPDVGAPPSYVTSETAAPASPAIGKYNALRQAVLQEKPALRHYRQDFLDACISYADQLRTRVQPDTEAFGQKVLDDCGKLKVVRDHLVDWVLLEGEARSEGFSESLIEALERVLALKYRPDEVTSWNDGWFEAHTIFVYETFLYVIAALLRAGAFDVLHEVLSSNYLLPETARGGRRSFDDFSAFLGFAQAVNNVLASEGRKLLSPAAALIQRQADRSDITFDAVMEADLMALLMAFVTPSIRRWYPQTLHYAGYSRDFPFFVRAAQHRHFEKLAVVTGIGDADALRTAVQEGQERLRVREWSNFEFFNETFWEFMNMDNLDTIN